MRVGNMTYLPAVREARRRGRGPRARGMQGIEDAVWPTTGDIDTETNSLDLSIRALGSDIAQASPDLGDSTFLTFLNAWNTFISDWEQWRAGGWFWNPTRRDELIVYRARFNGFLGQIQGMAGAAGLPPVTAITPVTGAAKAPDALDKAQSLLDKALVVGGLLLAGYVGWEIYKGVKKVGGS